MSPSLSLNFDYIDQLITKGEYDEAIQALITFENKQGLSDTEQLSCLIRRSTILNRLGQYNESFLLSQEVFQESKKQNYTLLLLDAIILMGTNLWRLGRLDESYTILEQGEQEIQKQPLYYASEYKQRVSSLIFNKGIVCRYQGNLDRALDYLQQSLALRIELGNEQGIAASLAYLGVIYHVRGQLENALTYYQQSLEIRRKSENKQGIAYAINNIGVVYHQQGDFEQALMHYFESKRYFDEINDKQGVSYPLNNIGISYYQQNDLKQGLHFLEQSLDFRRITGNNLLVAETLFFLLPVVIDCKDLDKAQDYVQQLKLISKETENKVVKQQYLVTKALLLKQSTRGRSLIKAAELLEQVVSEEIVDYNITVLALLNLCEILLTELKLSEDQEVYDEICIHVKRLIEIGKQQYSYSLLAETYWLQARLALLNLEMKKARNLLTQAQFIADEKGFRRLAIQISTEHDELLSQLHIWEELIERNASIQERMDLIHLEELVMKMIKKGEVNLQELESEEPVLFLILSETGMTLFSKQIVSEGRYDEFLIGGFLTAINNLIQEVFATTGSIERIRHHDYTIILKPKDSFLFCYIFKGQSYSAIKKLNQFITKLHSSNTTWKRLLELVQTNLKFTENENNEINNYVKEIFVIE